MYKRQVSGFVPKIAVNDRACEVLAGLAFGLESGTDFTAGVSGVVFVHNVAAVSYTHLDVYKRQVWVWYAAVLPVWLVYGEVNHHATAHKVLQ